MATGRDADATAPLTTEEVLAAEARAIHGDEAGERVESKIPPRDANGKQKAEFYRQLNNLDSAALCLSGGGIRSAAFALGVIQALATHPRPAGNPHTHVADENGSLLGRLHYLSTVSGGGYIGSWLSAWIHREGFKTVWENLVSRPGGPDIEPQKLAWLRAYSNYLTPKIGAMSADTWTAAAIVGRNLLLNWLVILPVLVGALLLLKLYAGTFQWFYRAGDAVCTASIWNPSIVNSVALAGLLLLFISFAIRSYHIPSRKHSRLTQWEFLWFDLAPSVLGAAFLVWALAAPCLHDLMRNSNITFFAWSPLATIWYGLFGGMAIYLLCWFAGRPPYRGSEFRRAFVGWITAGAIFGLLLVVGVTLAHQLFTTADSFEKWAPDKVLLLVFGVPWVLMSQLVAEIVLVGLTSALDESENDREWLGRVAGWILVAGLGWLVLMALVFLGSGLVKEQLPHLQSWLAPLGGVSGLVTALLGKSNLTRTTGDKSTPPTRLQVSMDIILAVSALIFAVVLIVVLSGLIDQLLFGRPFVDVLGENAGRSASGYASIPIEAWYTFAALALTGFVGWIASKYVNINRFSLHALYRNRLVRAFLGASTVDRESDRNPLTGFNERDNIRMWDLWPATKTAANGWRPFHVVNIALNIVSSKRLAWQERKAEPFTVSPLHSGSACKAFRSSRQYGHLKEGISLGTAMAISGAAATPNMGYHSAPGITFLMALLNVRLGWWLGNPGDEGNQTYRREGPSFAIRPLLSEMFGLTTDTNRHVYLSDGGHFENLGLYEMVRRRCRFIVVSDAGCDPKFEFEDLGNALRKISLDLGVRISFDGVEDLATRSPDKKKAPYHAIGTIHYGDWGGKDGVILYIKSAYHGIENIGIRSYAAANADFPHQSTGDQFFSESQFESYRALGFEITDSVLKSAFANNPPKAWTVAEMVESIRPSKSGQTAPKAALDAKPTPDA